jgi:sugar phosphate isomerase/epimerase
MALKTATGGFAIGFRRGWSDWQKDIGDVIGWAKDNHMACLDLGKDADQCGVQVAAAGLRIGSADLPDWEGLSSGDADKRKASAERNAAYIQACAVSGVRNFFVVVFPDPEVAGRDEQFACALEGYGLLADALRDNDAQIVVEGYPGNSALVIAPESYRRFLGECKAPIAVNYDPSHLLRMGIDPIRFLREFAPRVTHVHGKDTELFPEAVYEFGLELGPTRGGGHGFGAHTWRYTIPGQGEVRWREVLGLLAQAGYDGCVSIELEDENYNGSDEGEKRGILLGAQFLAGC